MRAVVALALLACTAWCNTARANDVDIDWGKVENPYLREVLFDFAQHRYFSALGHLLAERRRGTFKDEKARSEIMLAYAYLAYGLNADAGAVLQQLPPEMSNNELRNRVQLELANRQYQRGDLANALRATQRVSPDIGGELADHRNVFEAILLAQQQQHEQAVALLRKVRGTSVWSALGYFNLGTTLLRLNRRDEAEAALEKVVDLPNNDPEISALRDRANFVLGMNALRLQSSVQAKKYFQRIPLDSPFSNRALLGIGLAYNSLREHREALAAWSELTQRNAADRAVLDAWLAVPYAYSQLGGHEQSVARYKTALETFETELNNLDDALVQVRNGKVINTIVDQMMKGSPLARGDALSMPDVPEARYMRRLYESHAFQGALRNYRDLKLMQAQLASWAKSIYAVPNMSETFARVYVDQIANKQTKLATTAEEMKQFLTQLAVADMEKQRESLTGYVREAFFNLGQSYDRRADH